MGKRKNRLFHKGGLMLRCDVGRASAEAWGWEAGKAQTGTAFEYHGHGLCPEGRGDGGARRS